METTISDNMVGVKISVAADLNPEANYTAGTHVWHSNTLYRFTANHSAGAWTGIDAVQVNIGNELAQLSDGIDDLSEQLEKAENLVGKTEIGSEFDTETDYTAGQYVWYENHLYKFIIAHSAGEWTGNDAVRVALGDELASFKQSYSYDAVARKFLSLNNVDLNAVTENGIYMFTSGAAITHRPFDEGGVLIVLKLWQMTLTHISGARFALAKPERWRTDTASRRGRHSAHSRISAPSPEHPEQWKTLPEKTQSRIHLTTQPDTARGIIYGIQIFYTGLLLTTLPEHGRERM